MKIKNSILFCVFFLFVHSLFSVTRAINVKVIKIHDDAKPYELYESICKVGNDGQIDALLLSINHFGGDLGLLSTIADAVAAVNKKKPVISLIMGHAESMGYYIAASASYIIAHSKSEIGSIGVMHESFRDEGLTRTTDKGLKAEKVTPYVMSLGAYKGRVSRYNGPLSDEDKEHISQLLHDHYNSLIERIAAKRQLDVSQANEWADGKVFTADQALHLGLIDKIGTLFDIPAAVRACFYNRVSKEEDWEQYEIKYVE